MGITSLISAPYRWLAMALLAAAVFGFGWVKGAHHVEVKFDAYKAANDAAVLAQAVKGAKATVDLKAKAAEIYKGKTDEIKAITAQRDRAIGELRNRPERRAIVPNTSSTCDGASGAELARGDAEVLSRYAADAAAQQVERNACIALYNEAKKKLDEFSKP